MASAERRVVAISALIGKVTDLWHAFGQSLGGDRVGRCGSPQKMTSTPRLEDASPSRTKPRYAPACIDLLPPLHGGIMIQFVFPAAFLLLIVVAVVAFVAGVIGTKELVSAALPVSGTYLGAMLASRLNEKREADQLVKKRKEVLKARRPLYA